MEPKEKAKELVDKYTNLYPSYIVMFPCDIDNAIKDIKQCALISVDEILKSHHNLYGVNNKQVKFYLEVEQEIEKL